MVQQLGTLAVLLEAWGLIPRTHMAAYNHLELEFLGICPPALHTNGVYI